LTEKLELSDPAAVFPRAFYGTSNIGGVQRAILEIANVLNIKAGVFAGDNLITFGKSLGFLEDKPLVEAFNAHTKTYQEFGALWRFATLVWAARTALSVPGDFVECGCYKGISARIISDVVGFAGLDRRYFLYDLFEHSAAMPHHPMPEHSTSLVDQVRARFADMENVVITQGRVPDSLSIAAPETIAFMHLDLNNADAEVGALEVLFDRISPGGLLVLDDFGWLFYRDQQRAEVEWMKARGHHILELPTGQGLVIKTR